MRPCIKIDFKRLDLYKHQTNESLYKLYDVLVGAKEKQRIVKMFKFGEYPQSKIQNSFCELELDTALAKKNYKQQVKSTLIV